MYALCNRGPGCCGPGCCDPGCCDPGCCGPGCCAARFRRGCAAASRSNGRGRSAPGARVPHSSFRGGVAEPGIHGVRRLAGKPNPMDSRFRGNDGVIQGFLRSKWIPAFAAMTDLFKASLSKCHSHQQVPLQPSKGRPQVPLNLRAIWRHRNRHLFGQGVLQRRQQGGQLRLQQRHAARHRDLAGFSVA